jgi:hypothetical protein
LVNDATIPARVTAVNVPGENWATASIIPDPTPERLVPLIEMSAGLVGSFDRHQA